MQKEKLTLSNISKDLKLSSDYPRSGKGDETGGFIPTLLILAIFLSGGSWRVPSVVKHYQWGREYFLSSQGMENISLVGDEFYYISLKGYHEIAYIYPCNFFELDDSLKEVATVL